MANYPKTIPVTNSILKVGALLFGYAFWLMLAQNQTLLVQQNIPLSFYLPENEYGLKAPTAISVTLQGKRRELQTLNLNRLSAHIDASELKIPGTYTVQILPEHIFLPNYVKLMNYTPVVTQIELAKIEIPGTE